MAQFSAGTDSCPGFCRFCGYKAKGTYRRLGVGNTQKLMYALDFHAFHGSAGRFDYHISSLIK